MSNSVFYNNVKSIITNEGKTLLHKQSSGIKVSKVGAILFSDTQEKIKNMFDNGMESNITFDLLQSYTTLIYKGIKYSYDNGIYTPYDYKQYADAISYPNNYLPINISYGRNLDNQYASYDLILKKESLLIDSMQDLNFDGFAIVGFPFKSIKSDYNQFTKQQKFSIFSLTYFPEDKLQILNNQNKIVSMNVELHLHIDDYIELSNLEYVDSDDTDIESSVKFKWGLHLTNNGLHDRG